MTKLCELCGKMVENYVEDKCGTMRDGKRHWLCVPCMNHWHPGMV